MARRRTGAGLRVAVAGPDAGATDVVRRELADEMTVVELAGQNGSLDAVVLVDPTAACWLAARTTGAPVVAVVGNEFTEDQVVNSVLWGAEAVLHPRNVDESLADVLRAVVGGETVLSGRQTRLLAAVARVATFKAQPPLTARERDIAELIADGYSIKRTALALGITTKTVENLQARLFRKLGVRNRAQAAARLSALWAMAGTPHDSVGDFPT
ncbi:MAG: LuxR C-terminal-related transcriptional regulator [Acidimicrobiales bacterium]